MKGQHIRFVATALKLNNLNDPCELAMFDELDDAQAFVQNMVESLTGGDALDKEMLENIGFIIEPVVIH